MRESKAVARALWRVFPWNPDADEGAPFSATYLPVMLGTGRFDLPLDHEERVIYLAETSDHAVAEKLQDLRGQHIEDTDLEEYGHRLALVQVTLSNAVASRIIDLCDPAILSIRAIRPDRLASRRRSVTHAIAADVYGDDDMAGFRWWSSLDGDWHTVVCFRSRFQEGSFVLGKPQHLTLEHLSVIQATDALGTERI